MDYPTGEARGASGGGAMNRQVVDVEDGPATAGRAPRGPRARWAAAAVAAALAVGGLAACGGDDNSSSSSGGGSSSSSDSGASAEAPATPETPLNKIFGPGGKAGGSEVKLKTGMLLAMTGPGAYFGRVMSGGAKLAAEQIKAAGGPSYDIVIKDH